jgi:hypothetical protein
MKVHEAIQSKGMYWVSVLVGIIGGLALAVSTNSSDWSTFVSRAGLGFGIAWGLAYFTIRG